MKHQLNIKKRGEINEANKKQEAKGIQKAA